MVLARRVLAGDKSAFERLARRMNCVLRMLLGLNARSGRMLQSHEIDELCQDVWHIIWSRLGEFEGLSELEGWVYRICQFEFLNRTRRVQRRRQREIDLSAAQEVAARGDFEQEVIRREFLARGLEAVGGEEAEVIVLKHFEELTFDAIGERIGKPPSTVKYRYYEGLERLRAWARERGEGGKEGSDVDT